MIFDRFFRRENEGQQGAPADAVASDAVESDAIESETVESETAEPETVESETVEPETAETVDESAPMLPVPAVLDEGDGQVPEGGPAVAAEVDGDGDGADVPDVEADDASAEAVVGEELVDGEAEPAEAESPAEMADSEPEPEPEPVADDSDPDDTSDLDGTSDLEETHERIVPVDPGDGDDVASPHADEALIEESATGAPHEPDSNDTPGAEASSEPEPEPESEPEPDSTPLADSSDPDATVVRDSALVRTSVLDAASAEAGATEAVQTDGELEPSASENDAELGAAVGKGAGAAAKTAKKRRRRRRALIGTGIGVLLLAGAYVGAAYYLSDKVPQSTSVAGVDISGMSSQQATQTLDDQLATAVTEPISVTMGDMTTTIDPATAGLAFDSAATVDAVTGFTLDPRLVFGHLFGLGDRDPVVTADSTALNAALESAATDLNVAPVDGVLAFVDGVATVTTEPADGVTLDVAAAAADLPGQWLTQPSPLELPSQVTPPTIDAAAIDAAQTTIAAPLLSGPVMVQMLDQSTELSPAELAALSTFEAGPDGLSLKIDGPTLAATLTAAVPSVGETPQDASFTFNRGEPEIVPAVTGTGLDPDQIADAVAAAAVATTADARVAVAELAETEADFSTADAEALGIVEIVGEFSTPYPHDPTRTANLINGTANINGTLILPGETFSLIEALGPITIANGYSVSHVVEDGFVTDAIGGGLSQVSTTTFNAAYEAGMEDIEHKPHSRWFDRYPPGREATMFEPTLDMKWGNNTPYGVLVQAWVDQDNSRVHVRLWSTHYWDVEIVSSAKYNFTSPRTIYNQNPSCSPESAGPSGFTIDITRTISLDGTVNDEYSDSYSWTYSPWNRVVCGAPPTDPPADSSASASP